MRHDRSGGDILVGCTYHSYGDEGGYECGGYHPWWALDLGGAIGTPMYSAGAGFATIYSTGSPCSGQGYGNAVVVDHALHGKTIYAHLSEIRLPAEGKWVDQNTRIGKVCNGTERWVTLRLRDHRLLQQRLIPGTSARAASSEVQGSRPARPGDDQF